MSVILNNCMSSSDLNILLVGDRGVGKSTYIKRHLNGEFEKNYIPTLNTNSTKLAFNTSIGKITFNIWECVEQENIYDYTSIYKDAEAAIIMFDVTSRTSYKSFSFWYDSIRKICPRIPVVICGNKVDCRNRKVTPKEIQFHLKNPTNYFDLSSKSNYNFEKPFLFIARNIFTNNLKFIEIPPKLPPEVNVSQNMITKWENEAKENEIKEKENDIEIFSDVETEILSDKTEFSESDSDSESDDDYSTQSDTDTQILSDSNSQSFCWIVIVRSSYDEYQVKAICSSEEKSVEIMQELASIILPGKITGIVFINKILKNDICDVYKDDVSMIGYMRINDTSLLDENLPEH